MRPQNRFDVEREHQMRRVKSDRLLMAVGGLLGAFVGLALGFFTVEDGPGTLSPFTINASSSRPGQPDGEARLEVGVFDRWTYTRTAPDRSDFDMEILVLRLAPGILIMGFCFAVGVQAGAMAGRWAMRRSRLNQTKF
jgi:hypothetical protein